MSTTTIKKTFSFELILAGVSEMTPAMAESLYGAGCDDALAGSSGGVAFVDFGREAETLGDAIGSAVKDVERAGFAVARVEVATPGR